MPSGRDVVNQPPQTPPRKASNWFFSGWYRDSASDDVVADFSLDGYVIYWEATDDSCNGTANHIVVSDQPCRAAHGCLKPTVEGGLLCDLHGTNGAYHRLLHMALGTPNLATKWSALKRASNQRRKVRISGRAHWIDFESDDQEFIAQSVFWGWDGAHSCPLVVINKITLLPEEKGVIGHVFSEIKKMISDLL